MFLKIGQYANQNIFFLSILITNIHTVTPNEILGKISKKIRGEEIQEKGSNIENIFKNYKGLQYR